MELLRNKVTSSFGWRKNPIDGKKQFHTGVDLVNSKQEINAFIGGIVRKNEFGKYGEGNYIQIKTKIYELNLYSNYFHNEVNVVSKGERIHGNDLIGIQGSTGNSTGIHTHFEIFFMDYQINLEFAKNILKNVKNIRLGNRIFLEPYSLEKYFIKREIL